VQWATGNIGRKALRGIIEHPSLSLAGVHVYDLDKVGRDAGELCGLAAVGVAATGRIQDVLDLDADCVLYMARSPDIDEICQLLESGANVVATCGQFYHPPSLDTTVKSRVEAACEAGGTSVHSTGSSPGFISEAVPLVMTSIQRTFAPIICGRATGRR
jgi:2,4-diaminopentanoate dehydrogenase